MTSLLEAWNYRIATRVMIVGSGEVLSAAPLLEIEGAMCSGMNWGGRRREEAIERAIILSGEEKKFIMFYGPMILIWLMPR